MILVVADTGPVNYLVLIGAIELLASLAEKTVLPAAVRAELLAERAPAAVRAWATTLPAWAEVRTATRPIEADDISVADREAIALARELGASVLLMDDRQARRWAAKLGVSTIGTVGFLEAAAARELVSPPRCVGKIARHLVFSKRRSRRACAPPRLRTPADHRKRRSGSLAFMSDIFTPAKRSAMMAAV